MGIRPPPPPTSDPNTPVGHTPRSPLGKPFEEIIRSAKLIDAAVVALGEKGDYSTPTAAELRAWLHADTPATLMEYVVLWRFENAPPPPPRCIAPPPFRPVGPVNVLVR